MLKKTINKPIISFRIGTEARWHKAALLGVVLLVFSWRTRAAYANVRSLHVNVVIISVILQWKYCCLSKPVLRIHDIFGCIRIRIRGSMPLTNGSESLSCYPYPYLWLVDPDPGGPKTRGSGFGSATLTQTINIPLQLPLLLPLPLPNHNNFLGV